MKGIKDFDTVTAYEAMKNSAIQGTRGLDAYKKFGFIPAEGESESVSKTLEYAYDDWCIALAAKRMRNEEDVKTFTRRAQSWRNLYDRQTGFFRPRLNNSFIEPFDPFEVNFHYTEANAWQYSLAVPQDIPGLIEAHGGDQKFTAFLDSLFSASSKTSGRDQSDISGMIGQYAQGNEPSHHMAWLYSYCGHPQKTSSCVSYILNNLYKTGPAGLCGNEDCGQMSAWYVMGAMGIYSVTPGSDEYVLCPPQFAEVDLHLENGKTFVLKTNANAPLQYITSATLNGDTLNDCYIHQSDIMKGGKLWMNIEYTKFPDEIVWGTKPEFRPGIKFDSSLIVPTVPLVNFAHDESLSTSSPGSMRTFSGKMIIDMEYLAGNKYFTSINNGPFEERTVLFEINENSKIKAFAKSKDGNCSDTISFSYTKIPGGRSIHLNTQYANQYAANGNNALIDGIRGSENFRTGDWQGYEGKDLDAVVDLGSAKDISHIAIGFLQDQGAWIFMPSEVDFYSSMDGKNFTQLGTDKNTITQNHDGPILHDFYVDANTKARYIKIVGKNIGTCPSWHPGKGNPAWIFADEIQILTK